MKNLFTLCAALFLTAGVLAQAPEKMSYQAVVRDGDNNLVSSTAVGMQISILQGSVSGTAVYIETQTPTSNANGLVSLEIGTGTVVNGVFSTIDWANGPYFIKTETDPTGGTSYTITGTSQLLSVPYAMHANTADTVTGTITETDPVFRASVASGISASDTASWSVDNNPTNELQQLSVSYMGDTLKLRNGGFVIIPGISDANAPSYPPGTVHCSGIPTAVVGVINPTTGKTWMDRNLGASRAATSSTDQAAYGDIYQWGRGADGHQCRTSQTTNDYSNEDQPGHGDFILSEDAPYDWRSPQNDNLWQGVNGINNPCPEGYRIPTAIELDVERQSWSSNNSAGAFASPLRLPMAGGRSFNGSLFGVGTSGNYWSNTVFIGSSRSILFDSSSASITPTSRAFGIPVRCIKD